MNDINKQIEHRVTSFVSDLTALVRQAAVEAVADVLGSHKGRNGRSNGTGASNGARSAADSNGGRRSPEQIASVIASVLAYIKAHPNTRSEAIRNDLNLSKPVAHDSLGRLRGAKKIKMKGVKRAATYTAA